MTEPGGPSEQAPPPPRTRGRLRWLGIVATGVLVIVVALVALLQLPPVATFVVRRLLTLAPLNPGNRLEVGRVSGNFLHGLTLEDVRLGQNGRTLARVGRLSVAYHLPRLRPPASRIDELEVEDGEVATRRLDGHWDLLEVLRRSADTAGSSGGIAIDRLRVRNVAVAARLAADSVARVRLQDLALRGLRVGDTTVAQIDSLRAALQPPGSGRWLSVATRGSITPEEFRLDPLHINSESSAISGRLVVPRSWRETRSIDRLDVRLAARPLDLADLAALTPAVADTGRLQLDARAHGAGDSVIAGLVASIAGGRLTLDGGTRLSDGKPTSYRVRSVLSDFDPARLTTRAPAGRLNAELDADVRGPLASANGSARLRLARSRIGTTLVHRLELGSRFTEGKADLTLAAALDSGTVRANGQARPFDSIPSYRFTGSASGLPGSAAVARMLSGSAGDPQLGVRFELSGRGTAPDSATAHGRIDLSALRRADSAETVGHVTLRLAAGRLELRPELLAGGGTVTAVGQITFGDTLRYELRDGRLERVDVAALAGDSMSTPLSGRFALRGRGTAPAAAVMTAELHLDELRYGTGRVQRVDMQARLDHGRLRLDGEGALQGGRLVLQALGRPFDYTASYVLRRAALESVDLGTLLGRPDLAGPVTLSVTGRARIRGAARSAEARVALDSSRLGTLELAGGDANLRLDGERIAYDASLRAGGGALSLAGDGTTGDDPSYRVREGRLLSIDLGQLLGRDSLQTDLNATFTAEAAGQADSLRANLNVTLLPSRVNQAELARGGVTARMSGGQLEARLTAEGPDAGLDATVSRAQDERSAVSANGTLRLEHLAKWIGRARADGRVESHFALAVESDSAGLRSVGGTVDALGGMGDVRVPTLHLALRPEDGMLALDTVMVRSNVATIDGGGRLQLRTGAAAGTLSLRGIVGDLGPVAALMGSDTVGVDSARATLDVTGPARQWTLKGGTDAYGVALGGNFANRLTLTGSVTLDSARLAGVTADLKVKDAAYGKLSVPELTLVGGYDSTLALDLKFNVADSVEVATRVRGAISAARDTIKAELQRLTLAEGGRQWALERPATVVFGPRVEVNGLALRADARRIAVNGVFDRHGTSDLRLAIASLDLEALRAAGLVPIGGRVDGDLHLSGPATAPRLEGKVGLALLSRRGRQIGTVGTTLDWTDRGLRLHAAATPNQGSALTVDGTLPYRLTLVPRDTSAAVGSEPLAQDAVSLAVKADSFDLSLLQPMLPPDAATGLAGRLRADARIGGTIRAAQATGTVALSRAALELPAIKVAYEQGELAGRLDGDMLRVERLRLLTGKKEELTANGTIRLRPLSEPALDLAATLQHFRLVNSDQLQTAASGRVQLAGTLLNPELRGTLQLDKTNFYVGTGPAQARVEDVTLTPEELRRLARDFGPSVLTHGHEAPSLMDRVKLDMAIRMPRQVWIRKTGTPKTDIELMGNLRLTQEPGQEMRFFGTVEPVPDRGTLELSGRQFRLSDGEITLAGPVDSTKLDVNATYEVPTQGGGEDEGVQISVHARGRLDSLGLDFTSDPSMNQDDILSYIVTGAPASDNPLFERQSAGGGNAGEQVAFGALSNAISNAAGKSLGFDVFQIRQEPTRGLTLTAGRYVSSRLFLDLQLPLQVGSQTQDVPGSNLGPGFELEYRLERWLRSSLRGGSLSPGILLKARRAY